MAESYAIKKIRESLDADFSGEIFSPEIKKRIQEAVKLYSEVIMAFVKCTNEVAVMLTSDSQGTSPGEIIEKVISHILKSRYVPGSEERVILPYKNLTCCIYGECDEDHLIEVEAVFNMYKLISKENEEQRRFFSQIGKIIQGEKTDAEKIRALKLLFLMA